MGTSMEKYGEIMEHMGKSMEKYGETCRKLCGEIMRNFCAGCPPFWLYWHLGRSFCLDPAAHWPHLGVVWGAEQFMPNCQTKLRPAEVFDRGL